VLALRGRIAGFVIPVKENGHALAVKRAKHPQEDRLIGAELTCTDSSSTKNRSLGVANAKLVQTTPKSFAPLSVADVDSIFRKDVINRGEHNGLLVRGQLSKEALKGETCRFNVPASHYRRVGMPVR
jgi:hypothetical protein